MTGRPEGNDLDRLSARIRDAETEVKPPSSPGGNGDMIKAGRVGFNFLATVMTAAGLGWITDRVFGCAPWGLLGLFFAGFALGLVNIWRMLNSRD